MKRVLLILTAYLLLVLSSCSAGWHIKKAIKKDPSILQTEEIVIRDTVLGFTERVEVDSVFMVSSDTVTIVKDNLTVRHFYNRDSVYIFAECSEDTVRIYYEKVVPYEKVVYQEKTELLPRWLVALIVITLALYFLNKRGVITL